MMTAIIRYYPIEIAGYYATAVAISNIAYIIATFNMLSFQATDVVCQYDFKDYISARVSLSVIMFIILFFYIMIFDYTGIIVSVIVLQCSYRGIDALCEVFQGDYQRAGGLDVGCNLGFVRQIVADSVILLLIMHSFSLTFAIGTAILVKLAIVALFNASIHPMFSQWGFNINKRTIALAHDCLPLFFSAFLMTYIQSTPKLLIERIHGAPLQAYFTVIFMPAMVIHLLAGIIYRPMLTSMANNWNTERFSKVKRDALKVLSATFIFTILCSASVGIAIPVLEFIFGLDVTQYRLAFVCIMVAGGLNAMSLFMSFIITIIRKQKLLIAVYAVTALYVTIAFPLLIVNDGIWGAAKGFAVSMFIQFAIMFFLCVYTIRGKLNWRN